MSFCFLAFQSFNFSVARSIRNHCSHHPFPRTNEKTGSKEEDVLPEFTQLVNTEPGTKAGFLTPGQKHSQEL